MSRMVEGTNSKNRRIVCMSTGGHYECGRVCIDAVGCCIKGKDRKGHVGVRGDVQYLFLEHTTTELIMC